MEREDSAGAEVGRAPPHAHRLAALVPALGLLSVPRDGRPAAAMPALFAVVQPFQAGRRTGHSHRARRWPLCRARLPALAPLQRRLAPDVDDTLLTQLATPLERSAPDAERGRAATCLAAPLGHAHAGAQLGAAGRGPPTVAVRPDWQARAVPLICRDVVSVRCRVECVHVYSIIQCRPAGCCMYRESDLASRAT